MYHGSVACVFPVFRVTDGPVQPFLQSPDLVLEQRSEAVGETLQALDTLLSYFQDHHTAGGCDTTRLSADGDSTAVEPSVASLEAKAAETLLLLSSCGGIPDYLSAGAFRERIDTTFFRREIITRAAVAFQFLGRAISACPEKKDPQAGDALTGGGSPLGQGSAPASTKKDGLAGTRGETGLAAQRLYTRIRENFKALDDKVRLWSVCGGLCPGKTRVIQIFCLVVDGGGEPPRTASDYRSLVRGSCS